MSVQNDPITPEALIKETLTSDRLPMPETPDLNDVMQSFQMIPEQAEIWFGGRRMVMQDNDDLGILCRELIQAIGHDRTRSILTRIGYELGSKEAQLALDLRSDLDIFQLFTAGPQFHAVKGAVKVEPITFEFDPKTGDFYSEFYWHNSSECGAHLKHLGLCSTPGGWQQIGYASGFTSAILGRPIIFREMRCISMGHDTCFLIGKNADKWELPEEELKWFRADTYQSRPKNTKTPEKQEPIPQDLRIGKRSIVGASSGFNITLHLIDTVAETDAPVLFLGESGVGKEVFAQELHKRSNRSDSDILSVNCAAIPDNLIEAELFGVEKGAYTGAESSRKGRFERANGGTLFLDEIGTLSLSAQGKLLRVLQEGEFERLGGNKVYKTDVRLIAATNANLRDEVKAGRFREDLFFRLNVFPVHIPALRDRRSDIPLLINHFLRLYSEKHRKIQRGFDGKALGLLMSYSWPGNIRELENIVERAVILSTQDGPITIESLMMTADRYGSFTNDPFREYLEASFGQQKPPENIAESLIDKGLTTEQVIEHMVDSAMEKTSNNVTEAAKILGMTRSQLNYRLKQKQ